jgi:predicted permease
MVHALFHDIKEAIRSLARSAGTSLLAISVLSLGIGTSLAVFSVVDALFFRALPVHEPQRLVRFFTSPTRRLADLGGLSLPHYQTYRDEMKSLSGLALFREGVRVTLSINGEPPAPASAAVVSGNFFGVLGLTPQVGRLLMATDDEGEGTAPVLVLSDAYWRKHFGSDPDAAKQTVRLNGHLYSIVGVTPAAFHGANLQSSPDVFLTVAKSGDADPVMRGQLQFATSAFFDAVGRLAQGLSLSQAQLEANLIAQRLGAGATPAANPPGEEQPRTPWPYLMAAQEATGLASRHFASLLSLAVGIVVLVAVADLAALLLARSDRRRKELALRVALGAGRWHLIRQRLTEGLILAGAASAMGLGVAAALVRMVLAQERMPLPVDSATGLLSLRALAVCIALAASIGVMASIVPAVRASGIDPLLALKGDEGPRSRLPFRTALVVAQVALSASLLTGTGLLVRTLLAASRVPLGFDVDPLLVATLDPARGGYDAARALALQAQVRDRLAAIPGVRSVAVATSLPFQTTMTTMAHVGSRSEKLCLESVSAGYVETLGLKILRGRDLTDADASGSAALVNETAAERFWPGEDPLGKTITGISPRGLGVEVVGLVRARTGGPRDPQLPLLIVPRLRFYGAFPFQQRTALYVRAGEGDVQRLMPAVLRAVQDVDPDLPVANLRTARQQAARPFSDERLLATSFTAVAVITLLLAAAGLFGVLSSATEARKREIGIRMALGADSRQVLRLVVGHAARVVGLGVVLGIPLALGIGRLLSAFLFQVPAHDWLSLSATLCVLGAAGLLAAYGPLRRALAVAPMEVMRTE